MRAKRQESMFHTQKRGVINYPFDIEQKPVLHHLSRVSKYSIVRDLALLWLNYVAQGPRNSLRLPS